MKNNLKVTIGKLRMIKNIIRSLFIFIIKEVKRGTLKENLGGLLSMDIRREMSWGELMEEQAKKFSDKTFLIFEGKKISYLEMNGNASRMANYFLSLGGSKGKGVVLFMENSPEFLNVFIGLQKIGMYSVPVNTSLVGDSLLYILNHCDAEYLVIDDTLLSVVKKIEGNLENIKKIIVNVTGEESEGRKKKQYEILGDASMLPQELPEDPAGAYRREDICFITYTSGTTGLPKGVVYRYQNTNVKLLSLVAHLLYRKSDVLYTALKLFHGNALFVTVTCGLCVGSTVILRKKFSASRFWDDIRENNVTSFNTIGAMIPILMKQPENDADNKNRVRFVLSAACPADLWPQFEKRFGMRIFEAYGAVDGGGKTILNLGTAPVGSIGKPTMKAKFRLVDEKMNDVPQGEGGELVFAASKSENSKGAVEYYKNESATSEKSGGDWIFTGDIMRQDSKGYLYFVGRNTESMRIKGENVSAFEVEQAIQKHPAVLEVAVYAVPSELAEDEVMASVSLVDGKTIKEIELIDFIRENLPKFAMPRYIKFVDDFSKTETFRIKKKEVEDLGIIPGTFDAVENAYV